MKYYVLKISWLLAILLLCFSLVQAQMRVDGVGINVATDMFVDGDVQNANDHTINLENAATMNVGGNFRSEGTANYDLDVGTDLQIQGNLQNQTGAQLAFGGVGGLVTLDGGNQTVGGNADVRIFGTLALFNGGGIVKEQEVDVRTGNLELDDCELRTEGNILYVTNNASTAVTENGGFVTSIAPGYMSRAMAPGSGNYLFPVGFRGTPQSRRDLLLTPQNPLNDGGTSYGVRLRFTPETTDLPPTSNDPADSVICEINPNYHWEITDTSSGNTDAFNAQFLMRLDDEPWIDSVALFDNAASQWRVVPNQTATPVVYTAPLAFEGAASQTYFAGALVNPKADEFSWLPDFPAIEEPPIRVGDTVQFFANQPDRLYSWQFGDGGSALNEEPQYVYDRPGRYDVSLTVVRRDQPRCFASVDREIKVLPAVPLFLPTAFSPNEDQVNNTYYFSIENMEYVNFSVYNRWGQKIFEQRFEGGPGAEVEWDGKYDGAPVQEGVYVYVAEGVNAKNGQEFTQNGSITVIR